MRELMRSPNRKISGVAAGFAEYFNVDATLMRAAWLLGAICFPPVILAYLILILVMPVNRTPRITLEPESPPEPQAFERPAGYRRITKSEDRWLFGVCGGIASYLGIDPVIVRGLFLIGFLAAGFGLLPYLVLAILMPRTEYQFR